MLARNFKTAEELGLSEAEHKTLIDLLGRMERGEVEHRRISDQDQVALPHAWMWSAWVWRGLFNMAVIRQATDCGAVCCMLGAAREIGGDTLFPEGHGSDRRVRGARENLYTLFCPLGFVDYQDITVDEAAEQLRKYLTTGTHDWVYDC